VDVLKEVEMNSFQFNDAIRFKLATQQNDKNAKLQVFIGVLLGVLLRWIYSIAVDVIKNQADWCFGSLTVILIRLVVALVVTFFVFSGYWQKVQDQPASMRFWNALAYGITMDVIASSWLPTTC
jgi:Na+/H+-dicarboxylate symporter